MCISQAARVLHIDGAELVVEASGRQRRVSAAVLTLEGVAVGPGDWVLVHTGLAVARLHEAEARELESMHEAIFGGEER